MVLVDVLEVINLGWINDRKAINRILYIVQVIASIDKITGNIHGDRMTVRQEFSSELVNKSHFCNLRKSVLALQHGVDVKITLRRRSGQLGLLLIAQGNQRIFMDRLEGIVVVVQGHKLFPNDVGELSHVCRQTAKAIVDEKHGVDPPLLGFDGNHHQVAGIVGMDEVRRNC